ncbi:type II restriction endonuclease [Mycoplasma mycoides subsp. capri]|uniref:type II restriction endonuclease n=1 Tax=Mycoplasma mycoides TaxID=2102 RepID=UPI00223FE6CD|nr:type II restriction endonuclease [Mycoplasma mycoides]UZK64367.1 type II restriction endonuclease [Mycoplasma mycoides subsp. capri]
MALIQKRNKKGITSGSYSRVFDNEELGRLISLVHSTAISNGIELEKLILSKAQRAITDLNEFESILHKEFNDWNVVIVPKSVVRKSSIKSKKEPDFLILQKTGEILNIIELKDGWIFDTKKTGGEFEQLQIFQDEISKKISFITKIYICSFNNNNKDSIFNGLKRIIPKENIMTGKEFCDLLQIDQHELQEYRKKDADQNLKYFISELIKIRKVRQEILKQLSEDNKES